jgi:DNA invertase Pin-like site-specific DNA recombinase
VSERSTDHTITPINESVNERGSWGVDVPEGKKNRIAIYLRVSSREQNVDNQLPMIETYLRSNFPMFLGSRNPFATGREVRGFDLYWDHESGRHADRKAFGVLFNAMQRKKYDDIICWHVDRASRNLEEFCKLLRVARASDTTWHFVALHIRTDSPMMEFMAKFFALWGEHEVALKEIRQREGIERRRKEGKHMGRLPNMKHDDDVFELMRAEPGISINAVAKHFNKSRDWARRTMQRVSETSPPHDGEF